MWQNKDYFEFVLREDDTGKCAGTVMLLNIEKNNGKKYLWFGPNPTENILQKVSAKKLYRFLYDTICEFALQNGYDGVVIPGNDAHIHGHCTNRAELVSPIKDSIIKINGQPKKVEFGKTHIL